MPRVLPVSRAIPDAVLPGHFQWVGSLSKRIAGFAGLETTKLIKSWKPGASLQCNGPGGQEHAGGGLVGCARLCNQATGMKTLAGEGSCNCK